MKKISLTTILIVVLGILTTQAFAWGPGEGKRHGYCRGIALEQLNLTEDQKAKLDTLQKEYFHTVSPLREKLFEKSSELRELWLKADPDKKKITAKQKEVRILRDQLEDKRTAYRFDVNKILTKEQKEKLAAGGWYRKNGFGPRGRHRDKTSSGPGNCLDLP